MGKAALIVSFVLFFAAGAGWLLFRPDPASQGAPAPSGPITASGTDTNLPLEHTPARALSEQAMPLFDGEEGLRYLEDVAAAADHQQIRVVARYLSHREPELRTAAREALVQIGGEHSVDLLKSAAEKAHSPEEAAELRKAAAFVALPSWTEFRKQRAKAAPASGP